MPSAQRVTLPHPHDAEGDGHPPDPIRRGLQLPGVPMTERPYRQSWEYAVRDAFGWSGAAVGSAGAIALTALTAWYIALALCLMYMAFSVRSYRRAFVLRPDLGEQEPR